MTMISLNAPVIGLFRLHSAAGALLKLGDA